MKKHIFALLLSLAAGLAAIAQPSLNIGLGTTRVQTSTKFVVYPTNDLYFTHNTTTGTFQAKEVNSNNLVYSANISTVEVDTFSTADGISEALASSTHFRATISNLRYFFPKNRVSIRQRYPYVEVWPANGVARAPIFSGQADDLSVGSEDYNAKINSTDFLITNIDYNDDLQMTAVAGDSLGSGGGVSITGNMITGQITINSGTGSKTTGPLAVISVPVSFPNSFNLFLQEANASAAIYRPRLYVPGSEGKTVTIEASGTALPNSTLLVYRYFIVGYSILND